MTTRALLRSLTNAILRNEITVETARGLVLEAQSLECDITETMLLMDGNIKATCRVLGISKATYYRNRLEARVLVAAGGAS